MDAADIRDRRLAMLDGGWQPIAVHAPWSPTRTAQANSRSNVGAKRPRKEIGDAGIAKPKSPA